MNDKNNPKIENDIKQFLDLIKSAVFIHDRDLKIIYANKKYIAKANKPVKEIIGQTYYHVYPKMDTPFPGCVKAMYTKTEGHNKLIINNETIINNSFPIYDEDEYKYSIHILYDFSKYHTKNNELIKTTEDAKTQLSKNTNLEEVVFQISKIISNDLLAPHSTLEEIVNLIGSVLKADRCYIFEIDHKTKTMSNTHEYCSKNTKSFKKSLQNIPINEFKNIMDLLENRQPLIYSNIAEIPANFVNERKEFDKEGIQSILIIPIHSHNKLFGFLGLDSVKEKREWQTSNVKLIDVVADLISSYFIRNKHTHDIEQSLLKTIEVLSLATEEKDPYTVGHQRRVSDLSVKIAEKLKLSKFAIKGIRYGALVHDIGKIGVPSDILSFPGKLYKEQIDLIRKHPEIGYKILSHVDFIWPISNIVLKHHERLDGSGYPLGLKGDDIEIEVRIVSVCDVMEAMSSRRPYREGKGVEKTLQFINQNSGKLFDPKVVNALNEVMLKDGYEFPEIEDLNNNNNLG